MYVNGTRLSTLHNSRLSPTPSPFQGWYLLLISVRGWVYGHSQNIKDPIENRTHDLSACNVVPQPITLQRNPPDGSIVNKLPHFLTAWQVRSFVFGPLFSPHTSAKLSRFLVFENKGSPYMILVACSDLELCPLWSEGDGVGMTQWSHLQKYGALVLLAVVWP